MAYTSVNPATGEIVKTFTGHTDKELRSFLATAHALYHSDWCKGPRRARLQVLEALAEQIERRAEELARILVTEMGKRIAEARWEVRITAEIARFYARGADQFLAPQKIESSRGEAWVEYHPIGVVVAVEPWNFPYYQLIRVAAPNIAIGNPVLAKHASIVPRAALAFEELVRASGAPLCLWTNIFASAEQISWLIEDERVQAVALTGSEKAGSAVASQAAKFLKKSVLELGGADVFVVLDDADIDAAVAAGVEARLIVAGQVCNAAKRFLIHQRVADEFLSKFRMRFAETRVGDPMDESTGMGPLCSVAARDGIAAQVDRAVKAGATLHFGGRKIEGPGAFYPPTILTEVTRDNPAYYEEFFGPVATVHVVNDDEEIVEVANDSHFGLSGAIFAGDVERAKALASRIETGSVWINTRSSTEPELPFGGIKRSGYGRELSEFGVKELVNQKLILVASH